MYLAKPQSRLSESPARGGFTLAELLVVLIILAVMAAMVIPQAVGTADLRAQSAARIICGDLEYAQNYAIVTQNGVAVAFDVANNSYGISNGSGPLIHPITQKTYQVDFDTRRGFDGVSIVAANFGGAAAVSFDALGAPNAEGTVDVAGGPHTYRVTVAPVTGRVTVVKLP